jgi:hypothetical protein
MAALAKIDCYETSFENCMSVTHIADAQMSNNVLPIEKRMGQIMKSFLVTKIFMRRLNLDASNMAT